MEFYTRTYQPGVFFSCFTETICMPFSSTPKWKLYYYAATTEQLLCRLNIERDHEQYFP